MKGMNRICRISKSGSENRPLIPPRLSTGQKAVRENVNSGNHNFEVRSNIKGGPKKGDIISVDDYDIIYKYKKNRNE